MTVLQFIVPAVYLLSVHQILADYECVCNYNVEQSVLTMPSPNSQPIGYMYEFDCKPTAAQDGLDTNTWFVVAFEHKLGFVQKDPQIQQQICPGSPPVDDIITTTTTTPKPTTTTTTPKPTTTTTTTTPKPTTTTTTPKPTTTSTTPKPTTTSTTPKPTTTTTTTTPKPTTTSTTPKPTTTTTTPKPTTTTTTTTPKPTTTTTTTTPKPTTTTTTTTPKPTTTTPIRTTTPTPTTPTTTPDPIVGNIYLCPGKVQENAEINSTQLAQYETRCYELIMTYNATWTMAESKCVARGGHLADITDAGEQGFIERFLQHFTPKHAVWIGLNDRQKEGNFVWTSGAATSYYNWYNGHADHFLSHDIEDCTIFIPYVNGRWDDLPCQTYRHQPVHYPTLCEYDIPQ